MDCGVAVRRLRRILGGTIWFFVLAGVLSFTSACGGGGNEGTGTPQPIASINQVTVTCSATSILTSQTSACTASVTGSGSYNTAITWSVAPSAIGAVSSTGIFTPSSAGTAVISATSVQDPSKVGSANLVVANPTALAITVSDLPTGASANVTVQDPNGVQTAVTGTQTITAAPGAYKITASPVATGTSTYIAKLSTQIVNVASGTTASALVDYYNVMPNTTKILDSVGLQNLVISSDGKTLTISNSSTIASSLQIGDVLVVPPTGASGPAPMGLLRVVTAVRVGTSSVLVEVQRATLADAFQRLSLSLVTQNPADAISSVRTRSGVTFRPGAFTRRAVGSQASLVADAAQDPCSQFSVGLFDISKPISFEPADGISFQGQVEFCTGLDLEIDVIGKGFLGLQPQINSITATATIGEYSDLTLTGDFLSGSFKPDPIVLGTIIGEPIPVPGLPIWVTPVFSVFVGASGNVTTGFTTEASAAGSITGGIRYSSGAWTPVQPAPNFTFSSSPPTIDASLDAKAYAGVQVDLSFWDVIGPSFKPDGYLDFNANIANNPWWTLTGGVEGPMSFDVGFLGEDLASYDLGTMFDYSKVIASASGPFSPSVDGPVVNSLTPSSIVGGGHAFDLGVAGANFVPGATIIFGTSQVNTTWQDSGHLTALVSASLIANPGSIDVSVENPGGGTSSPSTFTVKAGSGAIAISPTAVSVPAGSIQTFSGTVSGGGAVNWSVQEGTSGGSISNSGIYNAPKQTGTYHVVATNASDATKTGVSTVTVVAGPTTTTIHSFDHTTEGAIPWAALILGSDGNFYGTTVTGGNQTCGYVSTWQGCGTIYKMDAAGHVTTLKNFTGQDGAYPGARLTQSSDGSFRGTTGYGGTNTTECVVAGTSTYSGCGTLFTLDPSNTFKSLYSFGPYNSSLGISPQAGLIIASNGNWYGANEVGGAVTCGGTIASYSQPACGAIFTLDSSNAVSLLHAFSGGDGAYPSGDLLRMVDGNLYGVTEGGGVLACSSYATPGCGTVFKMTLGGVIKTLHSFTQQDGAAPDARMILGSDGAMYGITLFGGSESCSGGASWQGCGTIFKVDSSGVFYPLHLFTGPDGAYPAELIQASDGYFYGTTESGGDTSCSGRYGPGCGTVFRMDSTGNVTVLHFFTGASDGSWPESGLLQGTDGALYGTAAYGGVNDDGIVFRISDLASLAPGATAFTDVAKLPVQLMPLLQQRPHVALTAPASFTHP